MGNTTVTKQTEEFYGFLDNTTSTTKFNDGCTSAVYKSMNHTFKWITLPCSELIFINTLICQKKTFTTDSSAESKLRVVYIDTYGSNKLSSFALWQILPSNCRARSGYNCFSGQLSTGNAYIRNMWHNMSLVMNKLCDTYKGAFRICMEESKWEKYITSVVSLSIRVDNNTIQLPEFYCDITSIAYDGACLSLNNTSTTEIDSMNISVTQFDGLSPVANILTYMSASSPQYSNLTTGCTTGLFQCADHTCVPFTSVYNGRDDCVDGSDEEPQANVCVLTNNKQEQKPGDLEQCSRCIVGSCRCSFAFYQCTNGGCIHWNLVCDGIDNCKDGSDESTCQNVTLPSHTTTVQPQSMFTCNIGGIQLLNQQVQDGYPDCGFIYKTSWSHQVIFSNIEGNNAFQNPRIPNEYITWSLTSEDEAANYDVVNDVSLWPPPGQLFCHPGRRHTFPFAKLCHLDYNEDGSIRYCRLGQHLRQCEKVQCSDRYKCPGSYCISVSRLCDSVMDCPHGEDELHCGGGPYYCPGMFWCRGQQCIHQRQVCDGYSDCPGTGEDESGCDVAHCPHNCTCGVTMLCDVINTTVNAMAYKRLRMKPMSNYVLNITNGKDLLMLEAMHGQLESLQGFPELNVIYHLNLAHNKLSILSNHILDSCTNLRTLILHSNRLRLIEPNIFSHLMHLSVLDMSHNKLISFNNKGLMTLNSQLYGAIDISRNRIAKVVLSVTNLDASNIVTNLSANPIKYVVIESESNATDKFHLISDNAYLCCFSSHLSCEDVVRRDLCSLEKPHHADTILPILAIPLCVILMNVGVLVHRQIHCPSPSGISFLCLNIIGVAVGVYGSLLLGQYMLFDWDEVPVLGRGRHMWCLITAVVQLFTVTTYPPVCCVQVAVFTHNIKAWLPMRASTIRMALVSVCLLGILVAVSPFFDTSIYGEYPSVGQYCAYSFIEGNVAAESMFIIVYFISFVVVVSILIMASVILRKSRQAVMAMSAGQTKRSYSLFYTTVIRSCVPIGLLLPVVVITMLNILGARVDDKVYWIIIVYASPFLALIDPFWYVFRRFYSRLK